MADHATFKYLSFFELDSGRIQQKFRVYIEIVQRKKWGKWGPVRPLWTYCEFKRVFEYILREQKPANSHVEEVYVTCPDRILNKAILVVYLDMDCGK